MIHVAYVRQKEALGLGHAVLMARELVGNEPFAVLLADDVIDAKVPCLKQMIDVFDEKQCSVIATQVVEGPIDLLLRRARSRSLSTGSTAGCSKFSDMVEKPKPEGCAVESGRHRTLHSDARSFRHALPRLTAGAGGELQLTDGLRMLLQAAKKCTPTSTKDAATTPATNWDS